MKYAFAGDRKISVNILKYLIKKGFKPLYLIVSQGENASHASELIKISGLSDENIIYGNSINSKESIDLFSKEELDYIIGIHFPYIVSKSILTIPKVGFLNLHPAYLPYNKGWHTPSWAIIDNSHFGATLHFMSEKLDKGDIINQILIKVEPDDTADSLYKKVLKLEFKVFKESLNQLTSLNPKRQKQERIGSSKKKNDLAKIQKLDLNETIKTGVLLDKLRALTTSKAEESAYYIKDDIKYYIQIKINKE